MKRGIVYKQSKDGSLVSLLPLILERRQYPKTRLVRAVKSRRNEMIFRSAPSAMTLPTHIESVKTTCPIFKRQSFFKKRPISVIICPMRHTRRKLKLRVRKGAHLSLQTVRKVTAIMNRTKSSCFIIEFCIPSEENNFIFVYYELLIVSKQLLSTFTINIYVARTASQSIFQLDLLSLALYITLFILWP